MIQQLAQIDSRLFLQINQGWGSPVWDGLFLLLSSKTFWWIFALAVLAGVVLSGKTKLVRLWILCGLTLGVSDATSYYILKQRIGRPRPCYALPGEQVRLVNRGCGSWVSMPSNHAANSMAAFSIARLALPGFGQVLAFGTVLSVGLSRVYLGVHYPGDILVGILWGGFVGLFMLSLVALGRRLWKSGLRFGMEKTHEPV